MSKEGLYEIKLKRPNGYLLRETVGAQSLEDAMKITKVMYPELDVVAVDVKVPSEKEADMALAKAEAKKLSDAKIAADKKIAFEKKAKARKKKKE